MRHGPGDLDQALHPAQALGQREDARGLAEALGGLVAAADAEREHAAAHAVAVLLQGDGAVRVRGQAGVVDYDDVRGGLEGLGDERGVGGCLARAQVQRLEAAVREPGVEGRGHGADGVLQEREPLVQLRGVEGGRAHDDIRVPVDVLGHRVHHDVGAVVQRVLHVGRQERVVDDDEDAVLVGDAGDGADVDERERRVRRRLDPDELGFIGPDQVADVDFYRRRERHLHAVREGDFGEVAVRPAVYVRHRHYV